MTNDILSEMLTCIRNAVRIKSPGVEVAKTRITSALAKILVQEGLIEEVLETFPSSIAKRKGSFLFLRLKYCGSVSVITNLQRLSRPGLRIYMSYKEIPELLGGLGLLVMSTSKGLITDREAKRRKLGGEILCSIWL